jgi:hypothetical protein
VRKFVARRFAGRHDFAQLPLLSRWRGVCRRGRVRKIVVSILLVSGAALLTSTPSSADKTDRYQVPAGTALLLKLATPIDSATASIDDQVEATLWSPVVQNGVELIPVDSVTIGKIVEVTRATERSPYGSVSFLFSVIEHAETGSRAMVTTRKVLVEAPRPSESDKPRKPKPVQATMASGTPFVAMTAEPLIVRIPR